VRPRLRAMPKARAEVNGATGAIVPGLRLGDESGDAGFEDAIRADAQHVADPLGFQCRFDRRRGHARVAPQENRGVGKAPAQRREQVAEILHDERGTRIATGPQARPQQQPRAAFEPDQRVIHMLVVPAVKERELLGPMGRIIGAVEIEHEVGWMLVRPIPVRTEPVDADAGQAVNLGPRDRVLQSRERRLRAKRRASIARHDLKGGIVPQAVRVVDVLVARRNLVEALAQQRGDIVGDVPSIPCVNDSVAHVGGEAQLLVEFSDQQQTRIGRERPTGEVDDEFWLESEPKLAITLCSHRTSSVGIPSRRQAPRKYYDFGARDGVFTYSFVNYPG
jgi:hypothetical protein